MLDKQKLIERLKKEVQHESELRRFYTSSVIRTIIAVIESGNYDASPLDMRSYLLGYHDARNELTILRDKK
jgi:hypothetical protein